MTDMTQEIIKRLDKQDESLNQLTKSINEFAQIVARKEVSDQHFAKQLDDLINRVNNHGARLSDLEKIAAGGEARQEIQNWVWRAIIVVAVGAVGSAIVWAMTQAGG